MSPDFPPVGFSPERVRRMYRAQNAIWLWIGFATLLASIAWVIDPATADSSAAGRALDGVLEAAYFVLLALGGGIIGYGVWFMEPRAEIIGHLFMGVGVFITSLAILTSTGVVVSGLTLFGIAVANAFRIYYLWSVAPRR